MKLFSIFEQYPNLISALSERKDGPMKFSGHPLRDKLVLNNRNKFFNKLGINPDLVVSAGLIHGAIVLAVKEENLKKTMIGTDGLLTDKKNLFLAITVADCLPIFLYDFQKEIIGLIHAGWRGLAKNILKVAIRELKKNFQSQPENILAGIGPGICQFHYSVGKEILMKFQTLPKTFFIEKNGKIFLDLKKIAQIQLLNLGLKRENIEISKECTFCLSSKYFSYRRDRPENQFNEAMIAIFGLR